MKDSFIDLIVRNFFKISFAFIMITLFIYIMIPFMISVLLGGILAMALAPIVEFIMRRGLSRNVSLIIFSLGLGIVGFIPVAGFFIRGSRLVSELLHESNLSELRAKFTFSMHKFITHISGLYDLDKPYVLKKFDSFLTFGGTFFTDIFNGFVADLPTICMMGLITLLAVYFFLKESDKIRSLFDHYFYFSKKNGDDFIHMTKACCKQVFFANIITGILQATIVSIGALVFDVGDFFLIFFITFVFSFIPVIGAAPVAAVLAALCFIEARSGAGVGMMIIGLITGISDNIIRPYLGSVGTVEVHPFIGFLSVIGGVIMFGLPGLFIGPLVASIIFGALPIIIYEYFPAPEKHE